MSRFLNVSSASNNSWGCIVTSRVRGMLYQFLSETVHRKNLFQLIFIIDMGITVTHLLSFNLQPLTLNIIMNIIKMYLRAYVHIHKHWQCSHHFTLWQCCIEERKLSELSFSVSANIEIKCCRGVSSNSEMEHSFLLSLHSGNSGIIVISTAMYHSH